MKSFRGRRRPARAGSVASGAAVVALLAGCAQGVGEGSDGKDVFDAREPLSSCGEIELAPGEDGDAELAAGWDCLEAARTTGAELVVTSFTVEGDPIVEYHRVGADIEGIEAYIDGTADQFGAQVWTYRSCPGTVHVAKPKGCWDSQLVEG